MITVYHHLKIAHIVISIFLFILLAVTVAIRSFSSQFRSIWMKISVIALPIALMMQLVTGFLLVHFATFNFPNIWIPSVLGLYGFSLIGWLIIVFIQIRHEELAFTRGTQYLLKFSLLLVLLSWAALIYLMTEIG